MHEEESRALSDALRRVEENNTYRNEANQRKADSMAVFAVCAAILTPRLAALMDAMMERARGF